MSAAAARPAHAAVSDYPIQGRLAAFGLIAAACAAAAAGTIAGVAFLVLFAIAGGLWRREEPPVLPFALAMQWIPSTTGYIYLQVVGYYPGLSIVGDLERAVLLSLAALLSLALGLRVAVSVVASHASERNDLRYDVLRLFCWVIATNTASWFVELNPRALPGGLAEILSNVLVFRTVLLCMLLLVVLRQRRGFGYAAAALVYATVPLLASVMSNFKEIFFLVLLALLSEWKPWRADSAARAQNRRVVSVVSAVAAVLLVLAVAWEGGMKSTWRSAVSSGTASGSPIEKIDAFTSMVPTVLDNLDGRAAIDASAARVSSGLGFFSLVLERVPRLVPHEDGRMTLRALGHVLQPRLLFPEKPALESDSILVRRYAGVMAAGDERGTSVGLGYIAQLYIDHGLPWMFVVLFAYGLVLGGIHQVLLGLGPSRSMAESAAAVVFVQHFLGYDSELAKQFGGLLQTALVFGALLVTFGPWLHRRILAEPARPTRRRRAA